MTCLLGLLGCVDVPEPPEEAGAADAGAAAESSQLAIDGGSWVRPATGEPYQGPECDPPAAHGSGAGASPAAAGADAGAAAPPSAGQGASAGNAAMEAGGSGASMPAAPGDLVIAELMTNPESVRDDAGEWFELYNARADATMDLTGCAIDDGSASPRAIAGPLLVEPGGLAVIARSAQVEFAPDWTMSFSLANAADALALLCGGIVIDRVDYGAGFPLVPGASMALDPRALDAAANDAAGAWCAAQIAYSADRGTPGAPNPACDDRDAGSD